MSTWSQATREAPATSRTRREENRRADEPAIGEVAPVMSTWSQAMREAPAMSRTRREENRRADEPAIGEVAPS